MDIGLQCPYDPHPMGRVLARVRAVPLFETLGTAAVKALPLAWTHAPEDAKRKILARVRDINPFASLPNNDNLRRAARLAWIAAALEIVKAAQDADQNPDWTPAERDEHQRFGKAARAALIALRDNTLDRKTPLADSPIDAHVTSLTLGVAEPIDSRTAEQAAHAHQSLIAAFRDTLCAVTGEDAVPDPVARVAVDGVPVAGDGDATVRRGFGELAFNEFARLLCDPAAFPEGREALRTLTGQWSLSVAQQTLALAKAHGARLGTTLDELSARVKQDLDDHLGLLVRIDETVGRVESKVDAQAAKLDRYIALAEADGAVARAADAGFTKAVVVALIERMDHLGIQADDLIPWVDSAIDRLRAWKPETTGDAAFDALCAEAARLFSEGRLDAPATLFRAERDRLRKDRVEDERRLLLQEIHYNEAAINPTAVVENLRELAALDGVTGADALGNWLFAKARDYYERGDQKGDNTALLIAIAVYKDMLKERTREREPIDWATIQNNLGETLRTLGERENGTVRLEQAADALRAALEEHTRDRAPLQWAMTQCNLGNALSALGNRESGTARLEQAVDAYRAALKEQRRDSVPLDWAMTQNNLGEALRTLGERENGTVRLEQAVDALRAALEEHTRDSAPLKWAMTQNNLGNALSALGNRENSTARLEQAVDAYRAALEEQTPEHTPLKWAMTQNNLGETLRTLGERENGTERLKQAVDALRASLKKHTREQVPLQWAMTQNNLGNALSALGKRENSVARLVQAVDAYRAALEEGIRDRVPLQWAMTQNNLGLTLFTLGWAENGTALLEQSERAFQAALEENTRDHVPLQWAMTQNNLGLALMILGARERSTTRLEQAVNAYRNALEERTRECVPLDWAGSFGNQGVALMVLAERRMDSAMAEQALRQITEAYALFEEVGHAPHAALFAQQMEQARALVARLRGGG
jgi:tetratricopeptide (TPR) repeat protein